MSTRHRKGRGDVPTEFTGRVKSWVRVPREHDFRSNGIRKPFGYQWIPEDGQHIKDEKLATEKKTLVHVSALEKSDPQVPGDQGGQGATTVANNGKQKLSLKLKIAPK